MFSLVLVGMLAVLARVLQIQVIEGDEWRKKSENLTIDYRTIDAVRGNIYAIDGSLLATSVPKYEVRFDPNADAISDVFFNENIDSLAWSLANLFQDKSASAYKVELTNARLKNKRYYLIRRNVKFTELKAMRDFPIFRRGRFHGGFIYVQQNRRQLPFRVLAARTIGYDRENGGSVGLEAAYGKELAGISGKRLEKKIAGGTWMPLSDSDDIDPQDGYDLVTTIDVNIQDVAEAALLRQLEEQQAGYGCVVLMEVETGYVKAIANLTKNVKTGKFFETQNLAVGAVSEPGSTFKLASLLVALEDNKIRLTDTVNMTGTYKFYDRTLHDSKVGGYGKNTIQYAFEKSSNIFAKIIDDNYRTNPQEYIDGLVDLGLRDKLGLDIIGEGEPKLKNANLKEGFSGVTLSSMAIGYEVEITPLQTLALYNAVANNGRLMKPQFVKEIVRDGEVLQSFEPVVLKERIASKINIRLVKRALEGVVERGTAKNIRALGFKIAGKTGTAKIAKDGRYNTNNYQASFCGYFPADNPKYSCIVVIQGPTKNIYGAVVSGTVFKEIADKIYANGLGNFNKVEEQSNKMPYSKNGYRTELGKVMKTMGVPVNDKAGDYDWVKTQTGESSVDFFVQKIKNGIMPNVVGMGLGDALYLLESKGVSVEVKGSGIVAKQSVLVGRKIIEGQLITLELVE